MKEISLGEGKTSVNLSPTKPHFISIKLDHTVAKNFEALCKIFVPYKKAVNYILNIWKLMINSNFC